MQLLFGLFAGMAISAMSLASMIYMHNTSFISSEAVAALLGAVFGAMISLGGALAVERIKRRHTTAPHLTLLSESFLRLVIDMSIGHAFHNNGHMNEGPDVKPEDATVQKIAEALTHSLERVRHRVNFAPEFLPEAVVTQFVVMSLDIENLIAALHYGRSYTDAKSLMDAASKELNKFDKVVGRAR